MKVNKNTSIACISAIIISGIALVLITLYVPYFSGYDMLQSMILGAFSSFIVSAVIAMVGYFHEQNVIVEKTDNNIKSLYINMNVLSQIIGNTLQQIHTAQDLSVLPFGNIANLSALNVEFLNSMELGLFSPLYKSGKLAQVYNALIEFQQVAYNIKNISWNLQAQTLDHSNRVLKMQNNQSFGIPVDPMEIQYLDMLKNTINIRTAKLHEYITGQTLELETLIKKFYACNPKRKNWDDIKKHLQTQIEDIVRR